MSPDPSRDPTNIRYGNAIGWYFIAASLLAMYGPTYWDVSRIFWRNGQETIAPVILMLVLWLIGRECIAICSRSSMSVTRLPGPGALILGLGLLIYVFGRSQFIYQAEVLSQIPVLTGLALITLGAEQRKTLWFPIFLLVFLVPIPGSVIDDILLPLKQWVSQLVTWLLYQFGYPVARDGVVLTIGNYDLLVADACSGLNSMVALSGIGLLYVYLVGRRKRAWNALLLASILPIAFLSNVARVLALVLVTYYAGDRAGRAFHSQAGYIEIVAAFVCFFAVDNLLRLLVRPSEGPSDARPA